MNVSDEYIDKSVSHLLKFQREDGHFEGELSSNTYPSCAYALVCLALGLSVDDDMINWFIKSQNSDGFWGLDTAGGSSKDATSFVKLTLQEIIRADQFNNELRPAIESTLSKIPYLLLNLWIIKLLYARCGYISWDMVNAPRALSSAMRLMEFIRPALPDSLLSRIKPPVKYAPPVRLFYTQTFKDMFEAEKYTLVPLFLIMELNNEKRDNVIRDLLNRLLKIRFADGSWFRVGLISALSVLALSDAKNSGYSHEGMDSAIREGVEWLQKLRSADGGSREALNLNVWDTELSIIALNLIGHDKYRAQINQAVKWLIANQNDDGGWPFSGMPGGELPSDADDSALAVLAILRSGVNRDHLSVLGGIKWLKNHQSASGGWGTYRPGIGDVNCVSITSHAILAFLEMGGLHKEINKAVEWIKSSISDEGCWYDLWLARNTYGTASAIDALIKAGDKDCIEVKRGTRWLVEVQNSDGGWGEDINGKRIPSTIEQTAWSTYALLLDNPKNPAAQKGIEYLLNHQNPDGSWRPSCVGIYWEVIGGYIDPVYPSIFSLMALSRSGS